ncbi:Uncharacterised protein [Chryseobacterium gleum]|uniref:Uncharacterized protein n=3 Tax=Bacteroidota TaxID=976 RepID=F0S652_PSESL|nr:hypothetical protein [Chryseobacterium sp. SC28]ADY52155.1 hypothetical protein Pedsa_1596 [Pseudopedobacter saltans DSM 12145]RRA97053.1 hypothetical protein EG242_00570 [Paenimyroides viscosum]VEE05945.1 Uncharacterised protein [Chryseobacterium gleum]HCN48326.1 hypothetical protein [Chryseobacterium sp.]RRQ45014.1 hypothetical protein DTW91_12510 [Chryseobacterium sp. SC28]
MPAPKKQLRRNKNPAQKKNLKNRSTKTVARTSPVKNVRMVTTAEAIANTVLADAVLQQLL